VSPIPALKSGLRFDSFFSPTGEAITIGTNLFLSLAYPIQRDVTMQRVAAEITNG
jgi:hypothetical protein